MVEQAVEAVHDVGGKAQEAAAVAKSTTSAAADATKRAVEDAASKAGRALETEEQRKRRVRWERAMVWMPGWQPWLQRCLRFPC